MQRQHLPPDHNFPIPKITNHAFLEGERCPSIVPSSSLLSSNPLSSSLTPLFSPRRIRPTAPSLAGAGPAVIGLLRNSEKLTFGPADTLPGTPAARSGVGRYGDDRGLRKCDVEVCWGVGWGSGSGPDGGGRLVSRREESCCAATYAAPYGCGAAVPEDD